jgi:hypothetical protein
MEAAPPLWHKDVPSAVPGKNFSAQWKGFFGRAFFCLLFFRASKEK